MLLSSSATIVSMYVPLAHTARRITTIDLRPADVSAGGNLHRHTTKEAMAMTVHERAEALKKELAEMGITTDAELQQELERTRIDISMFVNKTDAERKEETA